MDDKAGAAFSKAGLLRQTADYDDSRWGNVARFWQHLFTGLTLNEYLTIVRLRLALVQSGIVADVTVSVGSLGDDTFHDADLANTSQDKLRFIRESIKAGKLGTRRHSPSSYGGQTASVAWLRCS